MKVKFLAKVISVGLFISAISGCQSAGVSNSANQTNAPANNAGNANQSNAAAKIPEPQTVKFESAEKAVIVGTFFESPKPASPAVLLIHQWGSDRHSYDE